MVENIANSTQKNQFPYLRSQGRRRCYQQQQSDTVPHLFFALRRRSERQRFGGRLERLRRQSGAFSAVDDRGDVERWRSCPAAQSDHLTGVEWDEHARTHARTQRSVNPSPDTIIRKGMLLLKRFMWSNVFAVKCLNIWNCFWSIPTLKKNPINC